MRTLEHYFDLCVVGGGMAGMCTAISAARHGIKTALVQDRPVLGGNASSEIRMHICGAHGKNRRETGIIEEILLENYHRNTGLNYYIWDSVLYEKAYFQENLTLFLNCTVNKCEMDGNKIKSVTGWSLTSETFHVIKAAFFADCSGDSVLAPLTGASYMLGREAKSDYGESIPPDVSDKKTMGMSCLFQIRETTHKTEFIPPDWAYVYENDAPFAHKGHEQNSNWWWIELGGEQDSIHDTEEIKHELLKIAFGVWDHLKNRGDHGFDNWELDWIGFLPGKRESRRYKGKYVVTQNDVESEGRFDDLIAYGGWTMDDHFPAGFYHTSSHPTIYHPAPSPWGLPYRSLISENIENLCFAGRNISVTHAALSSSRVMATCALLGQALGTAVSMAVKTGCALDKINVKELQEKLMFDDCWLPFRKRELNLLTSQAKVSHPVLVNGFDRPDENGSNQAVLQKGEKAVFEFDSYKDISGVRLVFDSDLNRPEKNMPYNFPLEIKGYKTPKTLVKSYKLIFNTPDGEVEITENNNYQRLNFKYISIKANKVTFIPLETNGDEVCKVFAMDIF